MTLTSSVFRRSLIGPTENCTRVGLGDGTLWNQVAIAYSSDIDIVTASTVHITKGTQQSYRYHPMC